jgi:hypothetical protein
MSASLINFTSRLLASRLKLFALFLRQRPIVGHCPHDVGDKLARNRVRCHTLIIVGRSPIERQRRSRKSGAGATFASIPWRAVTSRGLGGIQRLRKAGRHDPPFLGKRDEYHGGPRRGPTPCARSNTDVVDLQHDAGGQASAGRWLQPPTSINRRLLFWLSPWPKAEIPGRMRCSRAAKLSFCPGHPRWLAMSGPLITAFWPLA